MPIEHSAICDRCGARDTAKQAVGGTGWEIPVGWEQRVHRPIRRDNQQGYWIRFGMLCDDCMKAFAEFWEDKRTLAVELPKKEDPTDVDFDIGLSKACRGWTGCPNIPTKGVFCTECYDEYRKDTDAFK